MNTKLIVAFMAIFLVASMASAAGMVTVTAYRDGAGYGGGDLIVTVVYGESGYDAQPEIMPEMGSVPTVTKVTASRVNGVHTEVREVIAAY